MTATLPSVPVSASSQSDGREAIVIALVNNMPDAALQSTEEQFADLLRVAGGGFDVRLRLFSFPELIRGDAGRAYVTNRYEAIERLWEGEFDGLIVTGAEPRTTRLPDEVYWPSLTRLIDWAISSGTPTIWSCLAAHAAVLHLSGVERYRLQEKISGLFDCARTREDPLLAGLPAAWRVPHSRHNSLDAETLDTAGYEILSHSEAAGPDTFLLRRSAVFVFYQGHPEYDAGALFREYRRDVGRFLSGTAERYPDLPRGYFNSDLTRALVEFRSRAHRQRTRDVLTEFPLITQEQLAHSWRSTAVRLYANWLQRFVSRTGDARSVPSAVLVPTRAV